MSAKGFLDLPGNVRRRIYRLLYTLDGCLFPLESTKDLIAGISLLRCCHQLCIEGCKILYGSNKIVLDPRSMHYAWFFLVIIGENNCRFLRHLCIDAIPCQYEADLVFGGEMDLVTTLLHLYDVSLETLELHLDAFSPHLPTNREIAIALSNLRTRVLIVSQRGEIRYWKAMARTMLVSQLRVLLPLGPGPAYDDLFDKNYFPERGDLNFIIIAAPKDHFFILPAEARKLIYELLLLESQEIRPLDSEVDAWIYPRWTPPWQKLGQSTGLLRACKQLSREATAVLYGNNVFGLLSQDARDADRWLRNIGSTNRRMIRYIRIDTDHAIRAWARYSLGRWNAERGPPRPFTNVLGHRIMAHAQAMELAIQSDFARATASCCTSTMMCLQLLQDCSNLSRVELFVPLWYHLDYRYPAALRFGACQGVAEVCQSIYNAIGHLYISTELRINCKVVTKDLIAVGVRLGLERLVVFWPKRFDDHQGQGIMVDQCDRDYWQAGEDRNELLIQFRPAKYGTDDTAIDAIWPKGST